MFRSDEIALEVPLAVRESAGQDQFDVVAGLPAGAGMRAGENGFDRKARQIRPRRADKALRKYRAYRMVAQRPASFFLPRPV